MSRPIVSQPKDPVNLVTTLGLLCCLSAVSAYWGATPTQM